jgi:hypothetical protein
MVPNNCAEDSVEFLKLFERLISGSLPILSPQSSLAKFRKVIEQSSIAYLVGTQRHEMRYFGSGWPDEEFKWFIRHLINNPMEVPLARNIILKVIKEQRQQQERELPWSKGKRVSL